MYYTPSGRSIHKVGVTPDVEVELPEKAASDVQLKKAEEYLKEQLVRPEAEKGK
jgi:carboxyl-terminal processing protease